MYTYLPRRALCVCVVYAVAGELCWVGVVKLSRKEGARIRKSSPQGTRGRQMMEINDLSVFYGGRYRKWSNRRRVATSDGRIAGKNACKMTTSCAKPK